MKLIKSSTEIIEQEPGLQGIYKQIELAGRTCYKSEDKITPDSAKKMVDSLIKRGHTSCLEHGTVYLYYREEFETTSYLRVKMSFNPYSKVVMINNFKKGIGDDVYISTNYRVLLENDWLHALDYICEPTEYHEKRYSVRFICDRGVSHELVRSRSMSFAMESQRYCNYSKDKFNNEITFIIPSWLDMEEGHVTTDSFGRPVSPVEETYDFLSGLGSTERQYFRLLNAGHTPQEARGVLPNATKTEVIVTGFASDWKHLFQLRSRIAATGKPHPDMQALIDPLMDKFIIKGYTESLV